MSHRDDIPHPLVSARWQSLRDDFTHLAEEEHKDSGFFLAYWSRGEPIYLRKVNDRGSAWEKEAGSVPIPNVGKVTIIAREESKRGFFCLIALEEAKKSEQVQLLATEAGSTLGRSESKPWVFWLDHLIQYSYQRERRFIITDDGGAGFLLRLCEASATFCTRLRRQALEREQLEPRNRHVETNPGRHVTPNQVNSFPDQNSAKTTLGTQSNPSSWSNIEIAFLSDERVEICVGGSWQTQNYGELGFMDRRSGKPTLAWETLREMAQTDGIMSIPPTMIGQELAKTQKRIEEIREKLRRHFKVQGDPIPFNSNTYQTSFKLSRRPSFDS